MICNEYYIFNASCTSSTISKKIKSEKIRIKSCVSSCCCYCFPNPLRLFGFCSLDLRPRFGFHMLIVPRKFLFSILHLTNYFRHEFCPWKSTPNFHDAGSEIGARFSAKRSLSILFFGFWILSFGFRTLEFGLKTVSGIMHAARSWWIYRATYLVIIMSNLI